MLPAALFSPDFLQKLFFSDDSCDLTLFGTASQHSYLVGREQRQPEGDPKCTRVHTHTQTHSLFSCDKRSMCNHVQSAHRCTETPSLKKSICGYIDHCWGLLMGHMGKQRGKSCLKLGLLLLVYFCMVGTWHYTDGRYDKIHDITREGKRKGKNKYHLKKKHYLHLNIQWSLFLAIFCPLGDLYAN